MPFQQQMKLLGFLAAVAWSARVDDEASASKSSQEPGDAAAELQEMLVAAGGADTPSSPAAAAVAAKALGDADLQSHHTILTAGLYPHYQDLTSMIVEDRARTADADSRVKKVTELAFEKIRDAHESASAMVAQAEASAAQKAHIAEVAAIDKANKQVKHAEEMADAKVKMVEESADARVRRTMALAADQIQHNEKMAQVRVTQAELNAKARNDAELKAKVEEQEAKLQSTIETTEAAAKARLEKAKNDLADEAERHVAQKEQAAKELADCHVRQVEDSARKEIHDTREAAWTKMRATESAAAARVNEANQEAEKVKYIAKADAHNIRMCANEQVTQANAQAAIRARAAEATTAALLHASKMSEMDRQKIHQAALSKAQNDAHDNAEAALATYHDHALQALKETRDKAARDVAAAQAFVDAAQGKQKAAEAATLSLWHTSMHHTMALKQDSSDKVHNARVNAIAAVMKEKKACADRGEPCEGKVACKGKVPEPEPLESPCAKKEPEPEPQEPEEPVQVEEPPQADYEEAEPNDGAEPAPLWDSSLLQEAEN
jgi:hypothetical protein